MDIELLKKIEDSGQWWLDPWWEDQGFLGAERYPVEKMREGIEVLKELFPAEWAKPLLANPQRNKVMYVLLSHYAGAIGALFHLGLAAKRMRHMPGFSALIERLKGPDSESAYFELEMADIFAEREIAVEFPRTGSQRRPDIIARCPDTDIEIECKHLQEEAWESWENDLTSNLIHEVGQITHRDDFDLQIELNERISDIRFDEEKYPDFNEAIMRGIVSSIKKTVIERIQGQKLPVEFEVPGLIKGRALVKGSAGYSYVRGGVISSIAKLRRIITNGVYRGISQLSGNVPGIICIYSNYLPEPELARVIFDSLTLESTPEIQAQFARLSALLLFPMQTLFARNSPLLLENRSARVSFAQLHAASIIQLGLDPVFA